MEIYIAKKHDLVHTNTKSSALIGQYGLVQIYIQKNCIKLGTEQLFEDETNQFKIMTQCA